jgi:hypothetical protein
MEDLTPFNFGDLTGVIIDFTISIIAPNDVFALKFVCKKFADYINTLCLYIYKNDFEYVIANNMEYSCSIQLKTMKNSYFVIYMKNHPSILKGTLHYYNSEFYRIPQQKINQIAKSAKFNIIGINLGQALSFHTKYQLTYTNIVHWYSKFDTDETDCFTIVDMILRIYSDLSKYCTTRQFKMLKNRGLFRINKPELVEDKYLEHLEFFKYLFEDHIKN